MNKTAKILAAVGAAAASAAALTVSTVSDYAINARSKMFADRHAGEAPLPQSRRTVPVTIQNSDGLKLTGHYLPAENPKRTVIAVHGWRSSWQHDFRSQCGILESLDCNVLFIDQRAHGSSEGKYIGFGITERFDCLEWLNFTEAHNKENLPIYLFGISMGGAAAHNIGQMAAACITLGNTMVLGYLPFLLAVSLLTGTLTGFVAGLLFRAMRNIHLSH